MKTGVYFSFNWYKDACTVAINASIVANFFVQVTATVTINLYHQALQISAILCINVISVDETLS